MTQNRARVHFPPTLTLFPIKSGFFFMPIFVSHFSSFSLFFLACQSSHFKMFFSVITQPKHEQDWSAAGNSRPVCCLNWPKFRVDPDPDSATFQAHFETSNFLRWMDKHKNYSEDVKRFSVIISFILSVLSSWSGSQPHLFVCVCVCL